MSVIEDKGALIAFLSQSTVDLRGEPVMIREMHSPLLSREGREETKPNERSSDQTSARLPPQRNNTNNERRRRRTGFLVSSLSLSLSTFSLDSTFSFVVREERKETRTV